MMSACHYLTATSGIPIGSFYQRYSSGQHLPTLPKRKGKPIEDLNNAQVFFLPLPSLNGLLNEETMVKLKSGTLSKEELVESLMGSTPLKANQQKSRYTLGRSGHSTL